MFGRRDGRRAAVLAGPLTDSYTIMLLPSETHCITYNDNEFCLKVFTFRGYPMLNLLLLRIYLKNDDVEMLLQ